MDSVTKEPFVAEVAASPDGVIVLTLSGDISSDIHGNELRAWVERAKAAILGAKERDGKARTLSDISELKNFDEGSVTIVSSLAGWSEAYDVKSAVIGANLVTKMALRTIVTVTKRTNLRAFDSKEEALAWLADDSAA